MENKKIPYAVFVLQYVENMIKNYDKSNVPDSAFEVLDDLITDCNFCPLSKECDRGWISCIERLKEFVEPPLTNEK